MIGRTPAAAERLADVLHEAKCGPVVWRGSEEVQWSDDHREWDVAVAKALLALGVSLRDEGLYPHRGSWRHAVWCTWEAGGEADSCSCELDEVRHSIGARVSL